MLKATLTITVEELRRGALLRSLRVEETAAVFGYFAYEERARNEIVVCEGEAGRALYLILAGRARLLSSNTEIGELGPGDHFGELALVTGEPRAVTVQAIEPLRLARLDHAAFVKLRERDPALGIRLLEVFMQALGKELQHVTQGMSGLLRQRSLPRPRELAVTVGDVSRKIWLGTPISVVVPEQIGESPTVAALMEQRIVSLATPILTDCRIEPVTTAHAEGMHVYRNSLGAVILEAACRLRLPERISLSYSVGLGRRLAIQSDQSYESASLAEQLQSMAQQIVMENLPLREEWWSLDEAAKYFQETGRNASASLLRGWRSTLVPMLTYRSYFSLALDTLVHRTGMLGDFLLAPDGSDLILVYGPVARLARRTAIVGFENPAQTRQRAIDAAHHSELMTEHHSRCLSALGTSTVGELNQACLGGNTIDLVRVAEGFQEKRLGQIADAISSRPNIRLVCVAGPSSSGKTTFIKRLRVQLQVAGIAPVGLSLDDYYVDRQESPRDEEGELDFEAFEALRLDLLREHLGRLMEGDELPTARYDFQSGTSHPNGGKTLRVPECGLLILEGIHGLNPDLIAGLDPSQVFRIYICPVAQLPLDEVVRVHSSDARLIRRVVRDRHTRGHHAAATIHRWPSVRRGERRHIFAFQHHAAATFDSSLVYELLVLRVFAERCLLEVPHHDAAYPTALRLLRLLEHFVAMDPDVVPDNSILREFIGARAAVAWT